MVNELNELFAIEAFSCLIETGVLSRLVVEVRSAEDALDEPPVGSLVGVLSVVRIEALFAWKSMKFFRSLLLSSLLTRCTIESSSITLNERSVLRSVSFDL